MEVDSEAPEAFITVTSELKNQQTNLCCVCVVSVFDLIACIHIRLLKTMKLANDINERVNKTKRRLSGTHSKS